MTYKAYHIAHGDVNITLCLHPSIADRLYIIITTRLTGGYDLLGKYLFRKNYKKESTLVSTLFYVAERVGFEPTRPFGLTDFESAPL